MSKKSLTLVAGTEHTRLALVNQLKEYISDTVDIKSHAIDEGIEKIVNDELVVLSSDIVMDELIQMKLLDTKCEVIIANRTIGYDYIDQIVLLPKGTDVLFVNDVIETTHQGISELTDLGIDYINFIPYYPGIKIDKNHRKAKIAITPGEIDKVPKYIEKVYDIGPRIMDFTTITQILTKLDILHNKAGSFSQKYLQKIINMAKRLATSTNEISNLNAHLNLVIDSLNDGFLVFDCDGTIIVLNENLRKILSLGRNRAIGRSLQDIIYNKKLITFLMNKEDVAEEILSIRDRRINVNKFGIGNNHLIMATFKDLERVGETNEKQERDLVNKGFFAKYTFEDIIGRSSQMQRIKDIARKLAPTELTILIEGESGTGKELFASAIHNASKRGKGSFLAVNFSALPDELIESELFGYEEGAFTGAKKGGKAGLFEQADGGTIFLDEIGDISMKVQARLLRVLQEKEVMRIGGTEIKPIDVRVVAATNKDLVQMVADKRFREDLYYRLKMGYIKLLPIRYRKEDIIDIMEYFLKVETKENIRISKEVIDELLKYDWYGNVREIKNILSYMLAVKEGSYLTLEYIPDRGFFQNQNDNMSFSTLAESVDVNEEQKFILRKIYELSLRGELVGRERLSLETLGTKYEMTKYQMRSRLNQLERIGLITKEKGKRGTMLSDRGNKTLLG